MTGKPSRRYLRVKAALDFLGALAAIVILAPVLVLVAAAVRLDSRGPAIYRQQRVGKDGKPFTMLKFRTMKVGAPVLSTEEMQRQTVIPYTRIGPILRKTNLDELPQLFNIIRGEMSFVGPRPALPTQTDVIGMRIESGADWARPGITGLAQVMGRDDLDNVTKVKYDAEYCRTMSLVTDIRIVFLTVKAVLSAKGNK